MLSFILICVLFVIGIYAVERWHRIRKVKAIKAATLEDPDQWKFVKREPFFLKKLTQKIFASIITIVTSLASAAVTCWIIIFVCTLCFDAIKSIASPFNNPTVATTVQLSDDEVRDKIIQQSISSYSGSCPCPDFTDRAGNRCGGRSAYSRPGGASPLCYRSDISDEMIRDYRAGL